MKDIFGEYSINYEEINLDIINEIKGNKTKYSFMDNSHFEIIMLSGDTRETMRIYWMETLQRIYIAAITGYLRQSYWISAICDAYVLNNYFQFTASVRGFLESSCDLYYSLSYVPLSIASQFSVINEALSGKLNEFYISGELEQILLHFQEAKKRPKSENTPDYLYPKQIIEYMEHEHLKSLNIYKIYSELCEITHPARSSLEVFMQEQNYEYSFNIKPEEDIANFILNYSDSLGELFNMTDNLLLIMLKELNYFKCDFHTKSLQSVHFDNIGLWEKISRLILE